MTLVTSKKTIRHPYMNPDLTFDKLREMYLMGMNGKLNVDEKLDGINYRFNSMDKTHSLGSGKFYSVGHFVEKSVFDDDIIHLMRDMDSLVDEMRLPPPFINSTIETELLLPKSPNVFVYGINTPTLVVRKVMDEYGVEIAIDKDSPLFGMVCNYVDICFHSSPRYVSIRNKDENQEYVSKVAYLDSTVSILLNRTNLTSSNTIGDYLYACATTLIRKEFGYSLSNTAEDILCKRWALNDRSIRLSAKSIGSRNLNLAKDIDKVIRKVQDEWFFPLYTMSVICGSYIIRRYEGYLMDTPDAVSITNERLSSIVIRDTYKDKFAERVLVNSTGLKLNSNCEGLVFSYNGTRYKFVGGFTWINQIKWKSDKK